MDGSYFSGFKDVSDVTIALRSINVFGILIIITSNTPSFKSTRESLIFKIPPTLLALLTAPKI